LLGSILERDQVAGLAAIARDRDALAVDQHVAVVDELARGMDSRHELRPVDDRIQPALEQADKMLGGVAGAADCLVIDVLELPLGNVGVVALELLLGAQLHAEVRELALAALAMLAGTVFAVIDGALRAAPDVL